MRYLALGFPLVLTLACGSPSTSPSRSGPASTTIPISELDGRDCDHAIPVTAVGEEYAWLKKNFPGYRMKRQSLSSCPAYPVDVFLILLPDGTEKRIYFNIQKIFESYIR